MQLQGRLLDIASGQTELPREKVTAYRRLWAQQGYALPDYQPQPPSLARKALNFGKALVKHVQSGRKIATPEIQLERLRICRGNTCGFFQKKAGRESCGHARCGCVLAGKVAWASESCPLQLWSAT